jgi:hypothetical protein
MSGIRTGAVLAVATVVSALIVMPAAADDLLEKFRARNELKVQKLVSDTNNALAESRRLEKSDAAKARDLLRRALAELEDDTLLPERQRAALEQQVRTRLRDVIARLQAQRAANDQATRQAADKARRDERAKELANDRAQSGPAGVAKKLMGSTADQVAAADRLRKERGRAMNSVFSSLEASATPIAGEVEYPKHWAAITEARKRTVGPRLTKEEVALLKALNSTLSVDFKEHRFRDVIDYLSEKTGQPLITDKNSLQEAMLEYDTPITFKVSKVTVRTILRKILGDYGLTYVIKDGTIQVVTHQKARDMMVVRTYPIDDLVGADPGFGLFLGRLQMLQNAQSLIQMIQNAIEPNSWDVRNGGGTIAFHEPTRSLVVRNSAEVHYMMGGGLR